MNVSGPLVVDASVAVKWFVEEQHFELARSLHSSVINLLAPVLLISEIGNAFLKKVRRGELVEPDAELGLRQVPSMVNLRDTQPLTSTALSIALMHQGSFYDSLYVALALQEECSLVTADACLYNDLRLAYPQMMVWIGDLPQPT